MYSLYSTKSFDDNSKFFVVSLLCGNGLDDIAKSVIAKKNITKNNIIFYVDDKTIAIFYVYHL